MSWFKRSEKGIRTKTEEKKDIPKGLWYQTPTGKIIEAKELADNKYVSPEDDYHVHIGSKEYFEILFDNKKIPEPSITRIWRFHKPKGCLVTHKDPEGRPTIFDILPKSLPRVMSVGRLDYDSEGLILLTNNGETSRKLELPSTGWLRKYKVRVHGFVDNKKLDKLKNGIKLDSFRTGPIDANLEIQKGTNAWVSIGLREGKNREVRRIMDYLGYPVNRLIRISYGPFQLGNLQKGETAEINKDVVSNQLGLMNKLK